DQSALRSARRRAGARRPRAAPHGGLFDLRHAYGVAIMSESRANSSQAFTAPGVVRAGSLGSVKAEKLTCHIGAELSNVNLGDASRDDALFAEIRALLLQHRVLFLRDQDIPRHEHVAFARRFGELEDHPVAGSDPDHPGLVLIYKSL